MLSSTCAPLADVAWNEETRDVGDADVEASTTDLPKFLEVQSLGRDVDEMSTRELDKEVPADDPVRALSTQPVTRNEGWVWSEDGVLNFYPSSTFCEICGCWRRSSEQWRDHVIGKKHRRNVKKRAEAERERHKQEYGDKNTLVKVGITIARLASRR